MYADIYKLATSQTATAGRALGVDILSDTEPVEKYRERNK
jgi:hypothetical protein